MHRENSTPLKCVVFVLDIPRLFFCLAWAFFFWRRGASLSILECFRSGLDFGKDWWFVWVQACTAVAFVGYLVLGLGFYTAEDGYLEQDYDINLNLLSWTLSLLCRQPGHNPTVSAYTALLTGVHCKSLHKAYRSSLSRNPQSLNPNRPQQHQERPS